MFRAGLSTGERPRKCFVRILRTCIHNRWTPAVFFPPYRGNFPCPAGCARRHVQRATAAKRRRLASRKTSSPIRRPPVMNTGPKRGKARGTAAGEAVLIFPFGAKPDLRRVRPSIRLPLHRKRRAFQPSFPVTLSVSVENPSPGVRPLPDSPGSGHSG